MTWVDGLMIAFDCESTGVDVEHDRIVTATVAQVRGADVAAGQWLADPGIVIPAEATAIHGISTETAREQGRPADEVVAEVGDTLRAGWGKGGIVVGFNLAYDFTLLDREYRRHLGRPFNIVGPIADAFVLDKWCDTYRPGKRNLTVTCEHYEVKLGSAHDALEDALASARICWRLVQERSDDKPAVRDRRRELAAMNWRDLYRLQVRAKAEQAAGLQDHLRAKARDAGESVEAVEAICVSPHWPIIPAPVPATAAATTE